MHEQGKFSVASLFGFLQVADLICTAEMMENKSTFTQSEKDFFWSRNMQCFVCFCDFYWQLKKIRFCDRL